MEKSSANECDNNYLEDHNDDEMSDDSEVSVANMNRKSGVIEDDVSKREIDDERPDVIKEEDEEDEDEVDDVIISDDDDDEYTYSEDSEFSDQDFSRESDMTNVTQRSSMSVVSALNHTINLDYPISHLHEITRINNGNNDHYSRLRGQNDNRENVRRMCSSVNDNRFSIEHFDSRPARRNMSFTNDQMRRIDLENQYLLKKIMAQQKPQNKPLRSQSAQPRVSSSAINRKKLQKRIETENMMLLRRIQGAKSCAVSSKTIPGYRLTSL